MRKGQGISLDVIIVAAIALLVLVILAFIFTGRIALFSKGLNDCKEMKNAQCEFECPSGYVEYPTRTCYDSSGEATDEMCCVASQAKDQ